MKATLIPEAQIFTLKIDDHDFPGMREVGQLGAVRLLKSDKGHEAYVFDGAGPYAKAFTNLLGGKAEVTVIAANQPVLEVLHPPTVAEASSTPAQEA